MEIEESARGVGFVGARILQTELTRPGKVGDQPCKASPSPGGHAPHPRPAAPAPCCPAPGGARTLGRGSPPGCLPRGRGRRPPEAPPCVCLRVCVCLPAPFLPGKDSLAPTETHHPKRLGCAKHKKRDGQGGCRLAFPSASRPPERRQQTTSSRHSRGAGGGVQSRGPGTPGGPSQSRSGLGGWQRGCGPPRRGAPWPPCLLGRPRPLHSPGRAARRPSGRVSSVSLAVSLRWRRKERVRALNRPRDAEGNTGVRGVPDEAPGGGEATRTPVLGSAARGGSSVGTSGRQTLCHGPPQGAGLAVTVVLTGRVFI